MEECFLILVAGWIINMKKKINKSKAIKSMDKFLPISARYKILLSDINRNESYIKTVHKITEGEEGA